MKTEIIKAAKSRLKRMSLVQSGDDSLFLNCKKLPLSEVAKYRQIISEMLASEDFVNPLEKLVTREDLRSLDEESKMRFLLDMSAIYVSLKNSMKQK